MKIRELHDWQVSPKEAAALQKKLHDKIQLKNSFDRIRLIAGCDIAFDLKDNLAVAGAIVYSFPGLEEVERRSRTQKLTFPYVPGLLAFREAPALLETIKSLQSEPDLFIFDGQGIAHPRRMGIASHLGLFLDKPTIGCAKSRLCGTHKEPAVKAGSTADLLSKEGEIIGNVVRTRDCVKPVFVSPGHKIGLRTSVEIILQCTDGYRIPKPTREADHFVESVKRRPGILV